ncbi:MAG: phosphoenolpyruvate carboxykinase (GTP) [Alphaproteobacteria bacterium]|nr:phosphoenolpyruvate carboxykinase (GTP) [Alphaproteobacteria bacterium]
MQSPIKLQDIKNKKLLSFIKETEQLCNPKDIYICDGSPEEYAAIMALMVEQRIAIPTPNRPGSYLFRTAPSDTARAAEYTYICTEKKEDAGPTNLHKSLEEMREMIKRYKDCMQSKTMYVIPFSMGPTGSQFSKIGVQTTDSPYVVAHMHEMTRTGSKVLDVLGEHGDFTKCMHACGYGDGTETWPCDTKDRRFICHDIEGNNIYSYGTGYGGNALLGKKCMLRIASAQAQGTDRMAEHMFIIRVTSPENKQYHLVGAFPSACGKTNMAMMEPTLPGWKVECLGDDIAYLYIDEKRRLRAFNPETGFFAVAPGTSMTTNPNMMKTIENGRTLYTNCALTDDGDVYWEGNDKKPKHAKNWKNNDWTPDSTELAAHANARFTTSITNCPVLAPEDSLEGVIVNAIIFGGRRSDTTPLVGQSRDWNHGVYLGATICSETTAATDGTPGELKYDPMAMRDFCGYNFGDYLQHHLDIGAKLGDNAPSIFYVNWFNKDETGNYAWPGFGDNIRVVEWMCKRIDNKISAIETPLGYLPYKEDFNLDGLNLSEKELEILFSCNSELKREELSKIQKHLAELGDRVPEEIWEEFSRLQKDLNPSNNAAVPRYAFN